MRLGADDLDRRQLMRGAALLCGCAPAFAEEHGGHED